MKAGCRVQPFFFCLIALCLWASPAPGSDMQNRDLSVPLRRVLHPARLRMEQGLYEKAVDALQKYQASNRPNADDHLIDFFFGNAFYRAGKLQEAAGHYEKAVKKRRVDAWLNLAQCRYGLSRYIKAGDAFFQAYETAPAKDPTAGLLALKADLLFELKRFGKAASAFEQLTKRTHADTGRAWLMLGYASLHIEDLPRARTAFQKASCFPEHREAAVSQLSRLSSEE